MKKMHSRYEIQEIAKTVNPTTEEIEDIAIDKVNDVIESHSVTGLETLSNLVGRVDTSSNVWVGEYIFEETYFDNKMKIGDIIIDTANDMTLIIKDITFDGSGRDLISFSACGMEQTTPIEVSYQSSEWYTNPLATGTKLYKYELDLSL